MKVLENASELYSKYTKTHAQDLKVSASKE